VIIAPLALKDRIVARLRGDLAEPFYFKVEPFRLT
jgi:hypothetical protein